MAKEPTELNALELEELEAKRLQNELTRMELSKLRAEVETKRNNKERGMADAQKAMQDRMAEQTRCNHHLGGDGALAIVYGQGDLDRQTCVSGIQFTDESILLRCNRCGKKWRNDIPKGNEQYGPWLEGVTLFRKSLFKTIANVGGIKITKQPQVLA